jgi:tight adherence protein B
VNPELALIAGGAGSSVMLAIFALARVARTPRLLVEDRLRQLQGHNPYVDSVDVLRDRRASSVPLLNRLFRRGASTSELRMTLDRAGLELRVGEYIALRMMAAVVFGAVGMMLTTMVGGLLPAFGGLGGLVFGLMAPTVWLKRRVAARRRATDTALVELCELMASMLESGFGYLQALSLAALELMPPMSTELMQMHDAIRLGAGVDEALEQLNQRLGSRDFDMLATAIAIQRRSGGSLAGILRNVARTIRERQLFRLEVAALTSRERYSALIVAGFPLLLTVVLTMLAPTTYGRLFSDNAGRMVLAMALGSDLIGYLAIKRVTRLEV